MFLSSQEMWDRPLGGTSREKEIPHWSGNIIYVVVAAVCKLLWRYQVRGRENLRAFNKQHGCLVIANHTSFFDVVFMFLAARPKQWVRFVGRDSLFRNAGGLLGQLLSRAGAIPIARDTADRSAIKRAVRHLKDDELVGILPEGTRRGKSDREPELHAGAALIARMAKVPILPMTVRNAEKIKQKGKFVAFPKVTIEYGHPIVLDDFNFLPKHQRLEACTWYAMRESFALFYNVSPAEVDMASLFPKTFDYAQTFEEHPVLPHTSEEVLAFYAQKNCEKNSDDSCINSTRDNESTQA